MHTTGRTRKTIAIIGGGVSGALTAYHVSRHSKQACVLVIDPRPELGLGLAYSTPSLQHLLNVPAGKISARPGVPEHSLCWLRTHHDPGATASTFAPRAVFGRYVPSLLAGEPGIKHVQASVVDLHLTASAAQLTLNGGGVLQADFVVLATGNFDPARLPGIDAAAIESGAYHHNAWSEATYSNLPAEAPVTLIGTGLTGVDVVLRLRETGHRGIITAVSRHGVFPNRHAEYKASERSAIPADTPATCSRYLRMLRAAIADGMEWRAAVDSLRSTTNDLWLALPLQEQKRFRRHLQRRWDVVRHRMAPPIADVIAKELAAGSLRIEEGHLATVSASGQGATVNLRTSSGKIELHTARVINCTGPSMNYRQVDSPLLKSLLAQDIATAGPLGGGLNSSRVGALTDTNGNPSNILFTLGPSRLGTLLESIAIPEIRQQAVDLADTLAQHIGQQIAADPVGHATLSGETAPEALVAA